LLRPSSHCSWFSEYTHCSFWEPYYAVFDSSVWHLNGLFPLCNKDAHRQLSNFIYGVANRSCIYDVSMSKGHSYWWMCHRPKLSITEGCVLVQEESTLFGGTATQSSTCHDTGWMDNKRMFGPYFCDGSVNQHTCLDMPQNCFMAQLGNSLYWE
jgi:hypothetical protein